MKIVYLLLNNCAAIILDIYIEINRLLWRAYMMENSYLSRDQSNEQFFETLVCEVAAPGPLLFHVLYKKQKHEAQIMQKLRKY